MRRLRIAVGLLMIACWPVELVWSQEMPAAEELPAYDGPAIAEEDQDDINPAVDTSAGEQSFESGTLTTTTVTGNAELPRVLYIVPWKKANPGDLMGMPVNSLLDDVLEPVDRGEFRRQLRYYHALNQSEAGDE